MRIRRIVCLFVVALVAALVLAPMALAQDTVMQETVPLDTVGQIPPSGGPAILLPAAAVLLGAGVLTYAVLRRV